MFGVRKAIVCVLMVSVAILCASCGDDHDRSTGHREARNRGGPEEKATYLNAGKPPKVRVEGRSVCTSAQAKIGSRAGAIDFVARCVGLRHGGPVDFVVFRKATGRPDPKTAIIAYQKKPTVAGPQASLRRAGCGLKEDVIECGVEVRGRVRVVGRIWVKPGTRCGSPVNISGITVAPCEGDFCEGVPKLHELFHERPRGC